jgi:hypothetical protein
MPTNRTRSILAWPALVVGAGAVLATGADHLYEYAANGFSTVPTIGTLFLLNFIAATMIGLGLLLPWRLIAKQHADSIRAVFALSGIALAITSLIGLWISETSSLFGFTDYGFRSTIVVAIVSEATAIGALSAFLALSGIRLSRPHPRLRTQ